MSRLTVQAIESAFGKPLMVNWRKRFSVVLCHSAQISYLRRTSCALYQDSLRVHIEELREALADFLHDDDFESDRFKRMLYTFSLKFAGDAKQFESGLNKDIRGIDKIQVRPSVSAIL